MKLSVPQVRAIIDKLSQFGDSPNCPICKTDEWSVSDTVVALPVFHKATQIGGATVPLVPLYCKNCGHTLLMSAIHLGVIDQKTGEIIISSKVEEVAGGEK